VNGDVMNVRGTSEFGLNSIAIPNLSRLQFFRAVTAAKIKTEAAPALPFPPHLSREGIGRYIRV
jgi:hypothetical protein